MLRIKIRRGCKCMDDLTNKDRPLDRYVSILESIAPFPDGLAASEIGAILSLPKTTVGRLLRTLVEADLVGSSSSKNRNFVLGRRLLRLLHTAPNTGWVESVTQRPLQALADRTGETCFIAKLSGEQVRSINCEAPDSPVRTYVVPGSVMPINAAASAKAILAWQDDALVNKLLDQALLSFTANTKTTVAQIKDDLLAVRERGYATDLAEHVEGLATFACPIQTGSMGVLYAVGLTGPYERVVGEAKEKHISELMTAARDLAKVLQIVNKLDLTSVV